MAKVKKKSKKATRHTVERVAPTKKSKTRRRDTVERQPVGKKAASPPASMLFGARSVRAAAPHVQEPAAPPGPRDVIADQLTARDLLRSWKEKRTHDDDGDEPSWRPAEDPRPGEGWPQFVARMCFALARVIPNTAEGRGTISVLSSLGRQLQDDPKTGRPQDPRDVNSAWVRSIFAGTTADSEARNVRKLVALAERPNFHRHAAEFIFRTYADINGWEATGRFAAELAEKIANQIRVHDVREPREKVRIALEQVGWAKPKITKALGLALDRKSNKGSPDPG